MLLTTLVLALVWTPFSGVPRLQSLVNPNGVAFTVSTDHAAVQNGTPVVTSYVIQVLTPTGTTPVASRDIGKPTPDAANDVTWMQLKTLTDALPVGTYVAKSCASGPGGVVCTPASAPFSLAVRAPAAPSAVVIRQ